MQTRENSITVTKLHTLPRTDRDCHLCEDGTFVRDGHELICGNCQHSPSFETREESLTAWEQHRRETEERASGEGDGRPRLVGGYPDAYWGDGEYCFNPEEGGFVF